MTDELLKSDIQEIVDSLDLDYWVQFSGKRLLMTGGRGFLGRYFTETFIRANEGLKGEGLAPCELVVLDNLITAGKMGSDSRVRENVSFVQHDVIKPFTPERPVDFILHAAGIASPYYYRKFPVETYQVATIGTRNVLDLARANPGCKLAFFSSSEIYGDPDSKHVPTNEAYKGYVSSLGPRACYDESKRFGEMMIRVEHEQHGVHGTIIRPFNVYGPGMQKEDYRVLPNFGARWVSGQPFHVYGDGLQTRTFCYITDAIRGFLQVLTDGVPGEPYNVGNPNPEISMRDLAGTCGRVLNVDVKYDTVEHPDTYPADEPQRRCPDITKIREQCRYEPRVGLEDGLKRFFGWVDRAYR